MAKKMAEPNLFPVSFETFRETTAYDVTNLKWDSPSCYNGNVRVRKYRMTIEAIDEPVEVIRGRIQKLWDECTNHHHRDPIFAAGMKYGINLRESHGQPNPPATPDPQAQ